MARLFKPKEDLFQMPEPVRDDVPPPPADSEEETLYDKSHRYRAERKAMETMMANHQPMNIPIDKIVAFRDNPYRVLNNEEMETLTESIQERGILNPLIVMKKPGAELEITETGDPDISEQVYELISGHRRLFAAKKAGLETVPAVVYDVNRDEAAIMVVDSNLHREHILPSEKAKAYKLRLDAMKRQGKRTDLTTDPLGPKTGTRSNKELSEIVNESETQIKRYVRLNDLHSCLLNLVDEGKIALRPAVELSYLSKDEQRDLFDTIESEDCTPSLAQAQQMRKLSEQGQLDMDAIFEVMTKPKPNQQEKLTLPYQKLPVDKIRRYAGTEPTPKVVEDFLLKAVDHYCRYLQRQRDRDAR